MDNADVTCWSMIRDAAEGDPTARERFARVYLPVVRAYLVARWRGPRRDTDDAAQDVFVECFRAGGLLEKADSDRSGGFRAFLLAVIRNVARRHEARRRVVEPLPPDLSADDISPDRAFDRAWTRTLLREAARAQEAAARQSGTAAERRVQLLRLRFHDGIPIRDIAARWGLDPVKLHHEYATAREEFRKALRTVVSFYHPCAPPAEVDRVCAELAGC